MIKFTSQLLRNISKTIKPSNLIYLNKMKFSTPAPYNKNVFVKKLESQIKYEQQNTPDFTQQNQFLQKNGWKQQKIGALNQLTKQVGQTVVYVVFPSRSPLPEEETPEQQKQNNQDDRIGNYLQFTVYVKDQNNKKYLFGDFILQQEGEINLISLNFTEDYLGHRILNKLQRPTSVYTGPDLDTLDQGLIEDFYKYFESLGINDELYSFLDQNSTDSEHPLYVNWLKDIKKFVQ